MTDVETVTETPVTPPPAPNGKGKKTKAQKAPSRVDEIRTEWKAAGSREADKSELRPIVEAWRKAETDVIEGEALAAAGRQKAQNAAEALCHLTGGTQLLFDNRLHEFSSRNKTVFLRVRKAKKNVREI